MSGLKEARGTDFEVILISNYPIDSQYSMLGFAGLLEKELTRKGVAVSRIWPRPRLGSLKMGPAALIKWLGYVDKFILFRLGMARRVNGWSPGKSNRCRSIIHICDHSNAVYAFYLRRVPFIVTCHDLLAIRAAGNEFAEIRVSKTGKILQRLILAGLNRATTVACDSQATENDLLHYSRLGREQVRTIPIGLNYPYTPMPGNKVEERLKGIFAGAGGCSSYILHIGGNVWYKNRIGLLRIYRRVKEKLKESPRLVLVGEGPDEGLVRIIKENGLETHLVFTGELTCEELRTLYSGAECLIFPSLYEGFGWPIVEAHACGCRVITTDRPPMNEVGGEAAVYCFPEDIEEASDRVIRLLAESDLERKQRIESSILNAARFSSERMVDDYIELYKEVLERCVVR